ncbi:TPA: hypothetical protein ACK21Z_005354 [Vibrio harveyi]|uniref:hypothetical protein n=1 Tax=Vibrio harveyi TaxID=669 RepID=UPI0006825F7E|nr:hypothetical protein [Vibrio harveyi]GEA23074.1 hypothetical protein VH1807_contig00030-0008 [Vibrio harveyi]
MKKLAFITVMLCSTSALAEVEYYGTINGSVKDYYPNAIIKSVSAYSTSLTSGLEKNLLEATKHNERRAIKDLKQFAQSMCAKHDGYFVDHYSMQHKPLSSENNLYTSFSVNIVCVNKPTEKK